MNIRNELVNLRDEVAAITPPAEVESEPWTDDERARALLAIYARAPEMLLDEETQAIARPIIEGAGRLQEMEPIRRELLRRYPEHRQAIEAELPPFAEVLSPEPVAEPVPDVLVDDIKPLFGS